MRALATASRTPMAVVDFAFAMTSPFLGSIEATYTRV